MQVALLGLLSGYHDHTAGSYRGTIDGCRGGVLQDSNVLYILNVEGCTRYAIHDIEYLIPTARPFASDIELRAFHRVTTIVLDGDTGHTTLKHISQICRARL